MTERSCAVLISKVERHISNSFVPCFGAVSNPIRPVAEVNRLIIFSNTTGTSVNDGTRKLNIWLDQWQSGKLGIRSRVSPFRAFSRRQLTFLS